jgi:predicted unusual protein kinase regulating ubiquinone biosynthesis (AarF/ABC1/UbiB family)
LVSFLRFHRDLRLMRVAANLATWFFPALDWLSMKESLTEFGSLMESQLDLKVEAHNLLKFRKNFSSRPEIVFPRPFIELCKNDVIVETYEEGTHVADFLEVGGSKAVAAATATPEMKKNIAKLGVDMMLKMVNTQWDQKVMRTFRFLDNFKDHLSTETYHSLRDKKKVFFEVDNSCVGA